MIDIQREAVAGLVFAGVFILIFAIGELIKRRVPSNPEVARKSVHLLGGCAALAFPLFIRSSWTVLILSAAFALIILVSKRKGLLPSVHGVERKSHGGVYYPAAVYLTFLLAGHRPVVYGIAILVMAVSDTLAALVGGKYGAVKFDVEGNLKSLEGSVVFFFVTFLCVHVPLLLGTGIGRHESVLIAFIIALLVTGFEAIALSGSDNIIVPLGTYFILTKMMPLPLEIIVQDLQTLLIIMALTTLLMGQSRLLKPSGLIAMMLLNYGAITLCNFYWFLPLVLAQVMYYLMILVFVHYEGRDKVAAFQVKVLLYIGIIPTVLLFTANAIPDHMVVYLPYLVAITAQIAIIGDYFFAKYISRPFKADGFLKHHRKVLESVGTVAVTLFVAAVPLVFYKKTHLLNSLIVVMTGTWVAYALNFVMNRYYRGIKDDIFEFRRRFVSAAVGVGLVFLLQRFVAVL